MQMAFTWFMKSPEGGGFSYFNEQPVEPVHCKRQQMLWQNL